MSYNGLYITKLHVGKTYPLYVSHRICDAGLLLAAAGTFIFCIFEKQTGRSPEVTTVAVAWNSFLGHHNIFRDNILGQK